MIQLEREVEEIRQIIEETAEELTSLKDYTNQALMEKGWLFNPMNQTPEQIEYMQQVEYMQTLNMVQTNVIDNMNKEVHKYENAGGVLTRPTHVRPGGAYNAEGRPLRRVTWGGAEQP